MSKYAPHGYSSNQPRATAATVCQKCLGQGHFTYQCKNTRPYVSRPSRTKQLEKPAVLEKLRAGARPSVDVPEEFKTKSGTANRILETKERERAKEKEKEDGPAKKKARRSSSRSSKSSSSDSSADSESESGSDSSSDSDSGSDSASGSRSRSRSLDRRRRVPANRQEHVDSRERNAGPTRGRSPSPRR